MWVAICSSVKGSPAAVDEMSPAVVGGVRSIFGAEQHENPIEVEFPADTSCPTLLDQISVRVVLWQASLGLAAKDGTCR